VSAYAAFFGPCVALTFAHRARCAAAIFFRAARLILRAGLAAWTGFAFAHRARWAAAILARPAALMRRRLGLAEVCTVLGGRPRLGCVEMPFKALMALSSRFRSAVSTATIC